MIPVLLVLAALSFLASLYMQLWAPAAGADRAGAYRALGLLFLFAALAVSAVRFVGWLIV